MNPRGDAVVTWTQTHLTSSATSGRRSARPDPTGGPARRSRSTGTGSRPASRSTSRETPPRLGGVLHDLGLVQAGRRSLAAELPALRYEHATAQPAVTTQRPENATAVWVRTGEAGDFVQAVSYDVNTYKEQQDERKRRRETRRTTRRDDEEDLEGKTFRGTPGSDRLVGTPGQRRLLRLRRPGRDRRPRRSRHRLRRPGPGRDHRRSGLRPDLRRRGQRPDQRRPGTGRHSRRPRLRSAARQRGRDVLYGAAGLDVIDGGTGRDLVYGGIGADRIAGGKNVDQLFGGDGRDRLLGERGSDVLMGGHGLDVLSGGSGNDRFRARDPGGRRRPRRDGPRFLQPRSLARPCALDRVEALTAMAGSPTVPRRASPEPGDLRPCMPSGSGSGWASWSRCSSGRCRCTRSGRRFGTAWRSGSRSRPGSRWSTWRTRPWGRPGSRRCSRSGPGDHPRPARGRGARLPRGEDAAERVPCPARDTAPPMSPKRGFGVALSMTAANPLTIASWAAIFSAASAAGAASSFGSAVLLVVGVGLGSATWDVTLATATALVGRRRVERFLRWSTSSPGSPYSSSGASSRIAL